MKQFIIWGTILSLFTGSSVTAYGSMNYDNLPPKTEKIELAEKIESKEKISNYDFDNDYTRHQKKRFFINSNSKSGDMPEYNSKYDKYVVNAKKNQNYEYTVDRLFIDIFDFSDSVEKFMASDFKVLLEFDYSVNAWNSSKGWSDKKKVNGKEVGYDVTYKHHHLLMKPSYKDKDETTLISFSDKNHKNNEIAELILKERRDYNYLSFELILRARVKWAALSNVKHSAFIGIKNENITYQGFYKRNNTHRYQTDFWFNEEFELVHNRKYDLTYGIDKKIIAGIEGTAKRENFNSWGLGFTTIHGTVGNKLFSYSGEQNWPIEEALNEVLYSNGSKKFEIYFIAKKTSQDWYLEINFEINGKSKLFNIETVSLSTKKIALNFSITTLNVYCY